MDFVFVYVAEAHAEDEWPISSGRCNFGRGPVRVKQPRLRSERLALARRFLDEHDGGGDAFDFAFVDDVEQGDEFEREFAPWPFRFFGVGVGGDGERRLEYVSHPRDATYDLRALRDWVLGLSGDTRVTD